MSLSNWSWKNRPSPAFYRALGQDEAPFSGWRELGVLV